MSRPFLPISPTRAYDVCAVGTALVDYLSFADYSIVATLGVEPGAMTLIDELVALEIRAALGAGEKIASGGTVANTAAGVALLGGGAINVGAIGDDDLGSRYESDLREIGVQVELELIVSNEDLHSTGVCHVLVTPDHKRTMATSLGVSGLLGPDFISEAVISSSALVYFDGYLLDFAHSEGLVERIFELAERHDTRVAFGLADPFAVERHGDRLVEVARRADLVIGNEDEAIALTGELDADTAVDALRADHAVVVTRGPNGALLGNDSEVVAVAAEPTEVVDTTGAGDLFASGVFYGLARGLDAAGCGLLGALCAAEAVSHLGARPQTSLADLARGRGLID